MMHTQHFEVNENVSRAMHTEYKTGEQKASTCTDEIQSFRILLLEPAYLVSKSVVIAGMER